MTHLVYSIPTCGVPALPLCQQRHRANADTMPAATLCQQCHCASTKPKEVLPFAASPAVQLRSEALPSALLAALPWPPSLGTVSPLQNWLLHWWPSLLGGGVQVVSQPEKWTLGLAATFLGFAGIIAADTGAYVGGKLMGRTPLTGEYHQ